MTLSDPSSVEITRIVAELRADLAKMADGERRFWTAKLAPLLDALSSQSLSLSEAREEIERLKQALKPFAGYFGPHYPDTDDRGVPLPDDTGVGWIYLNVGDFRRAQSALENGPAGLADATNDPPSPDLSSLRKGAE